MKKRHKLSRSGSRRSFTRHAVSAHRKNSLPASPMRGGIRL